MLALVFEYLRKVREEWLADGQEILFFKEMQTISNLAWNMYVAPDNQEHACSLSQAMIHTQDLSKVIKQTYSENVIEKIDVGYIK